MTEMDVHTHPLSAAHRVYAPLLVTMAVRAKNWSTVLRAVERRKGDMILSGREDVGRPYISRLSIRSIVPLYSGSGNASVPSGMTGLVEDDPKSIISNEILTNRYRDEWKSSDAQSLFTMLICPIFPSHTLDPTFHMRRTSAWSGNRRTSCRWSTRSKGL